MTDTTQELPPLSFQDEMHELQHGMITKFIQDRNALVGKANAANGDRASLLEQIKEHDTDPDIVEARERYSQAYLDLMALVEPKVNAIIADSAGSIKEVEEEIKKIDEKLKPGLSYYKKLYGEMAAKHLPTQERLRGASVGRTGAGGRRVRGFNVIITADGESEEFENFAGAAKYLDVETQALQKAFFDKAGTDVLKDVPDTVEFVINYEEVDDDENVTVKDALVKAYRTETTAAPSSNDED